MCKEESIKEKVKEISSSINSISISKSLGGIEINIQSVDYDLEDILGMIDYLMNEFSDNNEMSEMRNKDTS